jgi:hypothetical protein
MLILCILLFSSAAYSQNRGVKLEIIRSYYALDEDKPDDMLKRHGDYLYFRELEEGGTAGFLYVNEPSEAIYVLWGGKVIAGPLTTAKQVREVAQTLSNEMEAEHKLRTSIIRTYPVGRTTRYRLYDSNGNLIDEQ